MAFAGAVGAGLAVPSVAALFAEELGVVLGVSADDLVVVEEVFAAHGLAGLVSRVGRSATDRRVRVSVAGEQVLDEPVRDLAQAWDEVSSRIAALRDNPACAQEEHTAFGADDDPGLVVAPSFDPADDVAAPYLNLGVRPKVAILREQGVNSHVETAFAFDKTGFDTYDVHMTDLQAGRFDLADVVGLVACGGFSYGDTLGAGEGWARSVLFNERLTSGSPTSSPATTPSASVSATAARCSPHSPSSSPAPRRGRASPATGPSSTRRG